MNASAAVQSRMELCVVTESLNIMGKKWQQLVIYKLWGKPLRFNELKANVQDISARMLSETLQHLQTEEMVERAVYPNSPIRVEYSLTQKGEELAEIIGHLRTWGEKWEVC